MNISEEKKLLKRIRKDPQQFSFVYDKYYQPIFSYVFHRLGNYELSRDITAETFLKAFQKIGLFEWRNIPLSSWLFRIATNEINLYFRKSKYSPSQIEESGLYDHLPYEPGIETEKEAIERSLQENREFNAIRNKLLQLDIKYQEVIALRYFEEKSIHEISSILVKKEGTIKSLLSRGLNKLRNEIEKEQKNNATNSSI
jgi:RNA polymerase sigma-70 factor (ECF subfamily)